MNQEIKIAVCDDLAEDRKKIVMLLSEYTDKNNLYSFDHLACVLSDIDNLGYEVIFVSSGAIVVGANKLNMKIRPTSMRMKQTAAAVGHCTIMCLYGKFLVPTIKLFPRYCSMQKI